MIKFRHRGNFNNTERFFAKAPKISYRTILEKYAISGVDALSSATPIDSGLTRESWGYEIKVSPRFSSIIWTNSNVINNVPIAVILQYGHGTRNGGYVKGRDYINPAIKPIFDKLAEDAWKEVTSI